MKKADNFDAKQWLVENKITTQSRLKEALTMNPVESIEKYGFVKIRNREEYLQAIPILTQAGWSWGGGKFPKNPTPFDKEYRSSGKERKNSFYFSLDGDPELEKKKYVYLADVLDKNDISDRFPIGTPYSLG
jgi:hypothetical protein